MTGAKLYESTVQPLSETKYDLNEDGLLTFLQLFDDHITESAWEAIFHYSDTTKSHRSPLVLMSGCSLHHMGWSQWTKSMHS